MSSDQGVEPSNNLSSQIAYPKGMCLRLLLLQESYCVCNPSLLLLTSILMVVQKSDGNGGMVVKRVKSDGAAALTGTLQVCQLTPDLLL